MSTDGSKVRSLTEKPGVLHGNLKWSADGKYLLYDVSTFGSSSSEPTIQILEVESGDITNLDIQGYNAEWLLP